MQCNNTATVKGGEKKSTIINVSKWKTGSFGFNYSQTHIVARSLVATYGGRQSGKAGCRT